MDHVIYLYNILGGRPFHPSIQVSYPGRQKKKMMEEEEEGGG
jgi:hypothetical protein